MTKIPSLKLGKPRSILGSSCLSIPHRNTEARESQNQPMTQSSSLPPRGTPRHLTGHTCVHPSLCAQANSHPFPGHPLGLEMDTQWVHPSLGERIWERGPWLSVRGILGYSILTAFGMSAQESTQSRLWMDMSPLRHTPLPCREEPRWQRPEWCPAKHRLQGRAPLAESMGGTV